MTRSAVAGFPVESKGGGVGRLLVDGDRGSVV